MLWHGGIINGFKFHCRSEALVVEEFISDLAFLLSGGKYDQISPFGRTLRQA